MTQLLSIVVPVYNNCESLDETCRQILDVRAREFPDLALELIFVNDGSKDGSWEELCRLREAHKEVRLIQLSRNFGQLGALFAGFNAARGDAVICISADLQDPIELMGRMVAEWRKGTEIVICNREERTDGGLTKFLSGRAYAVARMSYPDLPPGGFDYWLMSARACRMLCELKGRHNFLQGQLMSLGFSKTFIPYTRIQRKYGKSGYSWGKKLKIIIDFFVDSSYLPIRAMSALGVIIALGGVLYSLMITYAWFVDSTPFPGWAPLMIMLMIIGGTIMVMLGVIGEYIWRIYDNIKDFPLFIVDEKASDT